MEKTRILYIEANRDGTIGGSYYSLLYLIQGLNRYLYEPIVMFYEDNPLISKFTQTTKRVIIFDHDSPSNGRIRNFSEFFKYIPRFSRDILWSQIRLSRWLSEIKPDIVHLNNSYAASHDWVLACKLHKIKIIAHDRGTRPGASIQTRVFVRFLDAIISVSDSYLKYVTEQGLKPKLARRVYNGLDVQTFGGICSPEQRGQVRRNLEVNEKDILIGMVGNIDYWKGQIVFVKALLSVMKKHDNVKAVLVGKTAIGAEKYEEDIRFCIAEHGLNDRIILTGYRDDIPAVLHAFDIFVHASIEPEPFGRVILEAMALKKPIIGTNAGGTTEQIVNGESGLLVPMDDDRAMADAILEYIEDMKNAQKMGQNAFERFSEKFTIQKMVHGVEAVYGKVLGE